jgi:hypothetical protein
MAVVSMKAQISLRHPWGLSSYLHSALGPVCECVSVSVKDHVCEWVCVCGGVNVKENQSGTVVKERKTDFIRELLQ